MSPAARCQLLFRLPEKVEERERVREKPCRRENTGHWTVPSGQPLETRGNGEQAGGNMKESKEREWKEGRSS